MEILIFLIGIDTGLREPAAPIYHDDDSLFQGREEWEIEGRPSNQSPPPGKGGYSLLGRYLNMSANDAGSERNDAFVYHGREG